MTKAGPIASAVIRSIRQADLPATDEAASKLAIRLAVILDDNPRDVDVFKDIAPKLNAILNDLGLTPAGRKMPKTPKGGVDNVPVVPDALAALRAKRGASARAHRAPGVDPTAG